MLHHNMSVDSWGFCHAFPGAHSISSNNVTLDNLHFPDADISPAESLDPGSVTPGLVTPGLFINGLVVIAAATAAYIYREKIQSGLSGAYNATVSSFSRTTPPALSGSTSALSESTSELRESTSELRESTPKRIVSSDALRKLDLNISNLDKASKSLEKYTLGGVEKEKLEKVIKITREILEDMGTNLKDGKIMDVEEVKKRAQEVKIKLNNISFEGKGVKEEDKEDVGYMKRALIFATQVLRNIFSFIGQFFSKESNPAAKALLNRSFFITTPTTPREAKEIQKNKTEVLDLIGNPGLNTYG